MTINLDKVFYFCAKIYFMGTLFELPYQSSSSDCQQDVF